MEPGVPGFDDEHIGRMLDKCRKDKDILEFVSTLLGAGVFWHGRSRLLMMLQPLLFLGGFLTGYYLGGGFE